MDFQEPMRWMSWPQASHSFVLPVHLVQMENPDLLEPQEFLDLWGRMGSQEPLEDTVVLENKEQWDQEALLERSGRMALLSTKGPKGPPGKPGTERQPGEDGTNNNTPGPIEAPGGISI
ncbi:unnamed protein product [Caenorhabditis nigoni]